MPLFDMECTRCRKIKKDVIMKMGQDMGTCDCGYAMKKLRPTGTGIILKGTGWAKDGYSYVQ